MKLSADRLASRLEAELGAGAVTSQPELLAARAIDGINPLLICSPSNAEQVSAALRICVEADSAVTPWGGGTAMRIGNLPDRAAIIIEMSQLNRVVEHDHANLTSTMQSGITLAASQEFTAAERQFVPFDAPYPERSTIGGIVAANLNGARRGCFGSVRDLVVGMRVALPNGEQIKAGGKVVKNVAGYDMCKLFVGSLGTLGIITEVTVRMTPVPETAATVAVSGDVTKLLELARDLANSTLLPAAVLLMNATANGADQSRQRGWRLAVRTEGFAATVKRHLDELRSMADKFGMIAELLTDASHQTLWHDISDFPLLPDRLIYRLTLPRAALPEFINRVETWSPDGVGPAIVADLAAGTLWMAFTLNQAPAGDFERLISLAGEHRGQAIMLVSPPEFKRDVDVWGPPPAAFFLMRRIKQQFDPKGLMNPGRFVGRL
jgi:glycolate oxidase FAD binding subunit